MCKMGSQTAYPKNRKSNTLGEKGRSWFGKVIKADVSRAYKYDPLTKQQNRQWVWKEGAPPAKQKSQRSITEVLLATFLNFKGIIYTYATLVGGMDEPRHPSHHSPAAVSKHISQKRLNIKIETGSCIRTMHR